MDLALNIYTDDTLTEVKRVAYADELKIPYRVSMYLLSVLDETELNDYEDIIKFVSHNVDKVDKIIKATFGVSDIELDCINTAELFGTFKELFRWVNEKTQGIKGNDEKN